MAIAWSGYGALQRITKGGMIRKVSCTSDGPGPGGDAWVFYRVAFLDLQ